MKSKNSTFIFNKLIPIKAFFICSESLKNQFVLIPPSSARVERLFGAGNNVKTVKRYNLSEDLFEN